MAHSEIPVSTKKVEIKNKEKHLNLKNLIGIMPNNGDSVEEIRQIRREMYERDRFMTDEEILKEINSYGK